MNLLKKTSSALIIIGIVVLSLVSLYWTTKTILIDNFLAIEKKDTEQKVNQAQKALLDEIMKIKTSANDYAVWDESYFFVKGENESYLVKNISDVIFPNFRINLIAYINASGSLIYAQAYDYENEKEMELPADYESFIFKNQRLFDYQNEESIDGVLLLPAGSIIITSQPILRNDGSGPIAGFLLMGRLLDDNEINFLAEITNLNINVENFKEANNDIKSALASTDNKEQFTVIKPLNNNLVTGYSLIKDIYDQPGLILSVDIGRDIYNQGLISLRYLRNLLFILIIFFSLAYLGFYFYTKRHISMRLQLITKYINEGCESEETWNKLKRQSPDEVTKLAALFQGIIEELKESRNKLETYNKELAVKIEGKTGQLKDILTKTERDKNEIEKQRQAILNILEDVSESQTMMKELNTSLEKKSQQLVSLKILSDELASILDVEESINCINKYLSQVINFSVATYILKNPIDEHSLIYKSFLQEEVSEKFIQQAKQDIIDFLSKLKTKDETRSLKIIKNITPQFIGGKLNNKSQLVLKDSLLFPLRIGDISLGVISLAMEEKINTNEESKKLVAAMILSFSFSVSHLFSLINAQNSKTVSLVESLNDGVIMFNVNKEIVLINPAVSRYTGFSKDFFNFKDFYRLFPDIKFDAMISESIRNGKIEHISDVQILKKYYEIIIAPVYDSRKKIVGGAIIIHDITHIKQIDQMKTEFVSVASHQLRTPLTAIKLFSEMLIKNQVGKLNEQQKSYLSDIYESTERMVRLVNDLLNITRIESGKLRVEPLPTDMTEFIKKAIAEAQSLATTKKIKINFIEKSRGLEKIPIDRSLILQVVHNLLVNAIRYTPVGGDNIVVTLSNSDKDNFLISVKDNGIGIPPEAQARIFEKFYRANNAIKAETEGTGLGLYVGKMIIESSDGKIWFESIKDKGTTFNVTLPVKGMLEKVGERGLAIS